jgi:hypothetical protein
VILPLRHINKLSIVNSVDALFVKSALLKQDHLMLNHGAVSIKKKHNEEMFVLYVIGNFISERYSKTLLLKLMLKIV